MDDIGCSPIFWGTPKLLCIPNDDSKMIHRFVLAPTGLTVKNSKAAWTRQLGH